MSEAAIVAAVKRRTEPKLPHSPACGLPRPTYTVGVNIVCRSCGRTLSWGSR